MPKQAATAQISAQGDPRVNAALTAERAAERAERDLNSDINDAIRATEQEVFDEALGDEPLDLDGDTSLEEMGEGLEGDDLPDDEEGEADEGAEEDDETGVPPGHTTRPHEARGEDQGEEDEELEEPVDDRGQQEPRRDQRGALREERTRRREAEERYNALAQELAELRGRTDVLTQQRQQQPPQQQQPQEEPEPDFLTYPDQWKDWNRKQAQKIARAEVQSTMSEFERRQVERQFQGLDDHMAEAANGPRSYEFHEAYARLQRDPRNPDNQQLVNRMLRSADPMKLLWNWWESHGGPEYRDQVARDLAEQLGYELPDDFPEPPPRRAVSRDGRRGAPQRQQQQLEPRHETRLPRPMRSLNDARGGGGRGQDIDPRTLDGSESSIFSYATASDR